MNGKSPQTRRKVLQTGLAGVTIGLAGCSASALVSQEVANEPKDSSPPARPIVENGTSDSSQNVNIAVTVLNEDGEPVSDVAVELEDRGGTPDDRYGKTGPNGVLRFIESVGPPPCNWLTIRLPDRGISDRLGCVNGNTTVRRTYQIRERTATKSQEDADYPVVDNAGSNPQRTVTVDLTVIGKDGKPVHGADIVLKDRGGTPDDRAGQTGPSGRIRFLEDVGPPPCNRQTIRLPKWEKSLALGCNNGGESIEKIIYLGEDE